MAFRKQLGDIILNLSL
ncbi:hypothetical protein A2U01_0118811, partial [Trifolium medium]|nr:hypothetical protein [Trifolium medium]